MERCVNDKVRPLHIGQMTCCRGNYLRRSLSLQPECSF